MAWRSKGFFYDCMARVPIIVREQRYKYAYYASGEAELYDLQEDPDELANLAGQKNMASVETRMRAHLLAHGFDNQRALAATVAQPQASLRVALEEAYVQQQRL